MGAKATRQQSFNLSVLYHWADSVSGHLSSSDLGSAGLAKALYGDIDKLELFSAGAAGEDC